MYRTLYENVENFPGCEVAMTAEGHLIIKEHFGRSIIVGLLAAILAAIAWALLEYWNGRVYELLPIPLGCFVGIAVGKVAHSPRLRILMASAIITVFGCVFGPTLLLILLELKAHHSFHYVFSHLGVLIRSFPHFVGLIGFVMWPLGVACAVGGAVAVAFIYISSQLSSDSQPFDNGTR